MVLLVTFLVYSSVSSTVFRMFASKTLDDGNNYLRSNCQIQCDSDKHRALQVYAALMIVVYPIGILVFFAALLFRNHDILADEQTHVDNPRVKSTTDLWKYYKPVRYNYAVVECGRRMLLTGVVVFIYPNTAPQIAITLVIAVAFMVIAEALAPFASRWDAWISRASHLIVLTSMYMALLLRVDISNERVNSQRVFEIILVTAHACMLLAVLAEAVVTACSLRGAQIDHEDSWPRRRKSHGVSSFLEDNPEGVRLSLENSLSAVTTSIVAVPVENVPSWEQEGERKE